MRRIIELDHDSAGIIKKNLMQIQVRHFALAVRDFFLFQLLQHLCEIGRRKRNVIECAGAALQTVQIAVAQIILEALRVIGVDADDVHDGVVVRSWLPLYSHNPGNLNGGRGPTLKPITSV